jgi:hypothetical protein
MKDEVRVRSAGRKVIFSTLLLMAISAVTLWLMVFSFSNLMKAFDIFLLLLLIASTYLTIVLIYSISTIFYNVDKLKGRQKRRLEFLEIRTDKEGRDR